MTKPFEPIVRAVKVRGEVKWEVDARAWPETMARIGAPLRQRYATRDAATERRRKLLRMEATGERSAQEPAAVQRLCDLYLASVEAEMATLTHRTYRSHLGDFQRFLARHRIDAVVDVSVRVINTWKLELLARLKPTTARGRIQAVSGMFAWAVRMDFIDANPCRHVALPKATARRRPMSGEEIEMLLGSASPELRPLWMFLLLTGLRRRELHSLVAEDFVLDTPAPFLRVRRGKGGKPRTMPLADPEPLGAARTLREQAVGNGGPLFTFGYDTLAVVWLRERDRIGLPADLTLHSFRHTAATLLANAEWPLPMAALRDYLGHGSVRTTETYVHDDQQRMRRGLSAVGTALVSQPAKAARSKE